MKRIGIIILAMSIILSTYIPSFAEKSNDITIDVNEWKNFYSGGRTTDAPEKYNGYLALYPGGDWVSYDISGVEAGTYSVSVSYGLLYTTTTSPAWKYCGFDLIVDNALESKLYVTSVKSEKPTSTAVTSESEYIYVPEGAKELKLKNLGLGCLIIDNISLAKVSKKDMSENIKLYAQNAAVQYDDSDSDKIKAGTTVRDEDFYDADATLRTAYTNTKTVMNSQESRILDNTDWVRFDVSDFPVGCYNIKVLYASKTDISLKFKTDNTEKVYKQFNQNRSRSFKH